MSKETKNKLSVLLSEKVNLKKNDYYYSGKCPICNNETLIIDDETDTYMCLSCGKGGNYNNYLIENEKVKAYHLYDKDIEIPKKYNEIKKKLYRINNIAADYFYHILLNKENRGYEYLTKKRKLELKTIDKFKLGYCPVRNTLYDILSKKGYDDEILLMSGLFFRSEKSGIIYCKFKGRVIFPILDINNDIVGFGGRVIDASAKPKYLNSCETPVFNKSAILYGMNIAKNSNSNSFIICEGYLDVITMHQEGFDNVVAPLGTALSFVQIDLLKSYKENIILMQDSDDAGNKAKDNAYKKIISKNIEPDFVVLSPAKDPDEFLNKYGSEKLKERIEKRVPYLNYKISSFKSSENINDPVIYLKFIREIAEELEK